MLIEAATDTQLRSKGGDFMQIQNTNCSWKPNILQGPSILLHTHSNPWNGGEGGLAWDQLVPQINRRPFSLDILYLPLSTVAPLSICSLMSQNQSYNHIDLYLVLFKNSPLNFFYRRRIYSTFQNPVDSKFPCIHFHILPCCLAFMGQPHGIIWKWERRRWGGGGPFHVQIP